MPRKKKRPEKYYGKSEDEWKQWGEEFGERMEKWGDHFGKRMERKYGGRDWWYKHFGFVGPLIGSIFGIFILAIAIVILRVLNFIVGSGFILAVANFLFNNLPLLFAISIFFGYNEYFSRKFRKTYWMISPITTALSVVIALWFASWVLTLLNTIPRLNVLASASNVLITYTPMIFIIFVVVGYAVVIINKFFFFMTRY